MKRLSLCIMLLFTLCGCQQTEAEEPPAINTIQLDDNGILFNGKPVTQDPSAIVYTANDIVYYPAGRDFTFGEGTGTDAHEAAEADAHTVVHITEPGTYTITGKLSAGQLAVDLGDDAENDPDAVVELILNNADITCTVAPAVIFYRVYECGITENPSSDVDTSAAGAIVRLADGSINNIQGSYVARIYKPGTVELNEDGTKVSDAKKLHKYDAAFYSRMSMNIDGKDGILNILAENEGLDSEMHLTINGGDIRIESGNDGINTNEDGVSVTTINGGKVSITVNGTTGEGDGIDSNGWLVINGGTVVSAACSFSGDAGIDSDMGIHINGGTVIATGNMLDGISESNQTYAVFSFADRQTAGTEYTLSGDAFKMSFAPVNDFTYLIVSDEALSPGEYKLYSGEKQLGVTVGGEFDGMGGHRMEGIVPPDNGQMPDSRPAFPDGMEFPERGTFPPDGVEAPKREMMDPGTTTPPEAKEMPPDGNPFGDGRGEFGKAPLTGEQSPVFTIRAGANSFHGITPYTE